MSARSRGSFVGASGLVLTCALVPGACAPSSGQGLPPASPTPLPLELGLRAQERVVAADLVAEGEASYCAAWLDAAAADETRTTRLFTACGGAQGWAAPELLGTGGSALRLVAGARRAHLLVEPGGRHWAREQGGSWRELEPLLPPQGARLRAFDAAVVEGALLVAYLCDGGADARPDETRLLALRVDGEGPPAQVVVATWPASTFDPARPAFRVEGDVVDLLVGRNVARQRGRGVSVAGELTLHTSRDAGRTWGEPGSVPVDDELRTGARTGSIDSVALLAHEGRRYAFYSCLGVYGSEAGPDGRWSAPTRLFDYRTSMSRGTHTSAALTAVALPTGLVVAWIDERNRSSRRGMSNPLGGLPWSDDLTHLLENDAFVARGVVEGAGPPSWSVERLTAASSFAHSLRLTGSEDSAAAFWVGRSGVGKDLDSFPSPPQLYLSTVRRP